jgi:hypothetical protein
MAAPACRRARVPPRPCAGPARHGKNGRDQPVRQPGPAQRPAGGGERQHRRGMGEVDLSAGGQHPGVRRRCGHRCLDQVPDAEYPRHGQRARAGRPGTG